MRGEQLIHLLPFAISGTFPQDELIEAIERVYNLNATVLDIRYDPITLFDASCSQYRANEILAEIAAFIQGDHDKIVGVTEIDLFTPILTYIFGQAYLGGNAAIVSGYRLQNQRYGLPADENLYIARLRKSVIHELGHSFSLRHCRKQNCVMHSATYVEEIDLKSEGLCDDCTSRINV